MATVLRHRIDDLRLAMMILTRVPMGHWRLLDGATLGRALWAYPIAGAVVGAIAGGIFYVCAFAGLPSSMSAAVALIASVLASGSLHEDGLADFADGLGGGGDRARKLEIMRDSRIGTYGTVALILSYLVRWSALVALADPYTVFIVWIAADALSRGSIALPLAFLGPARADGLGVQAASPPSSSAWMAGIIAVAIATALLGLHALPLIAAAVVAAVVVSLLAYRHLQGQTGDVLGADALIAESLSLVAACTRWF